ncbi:hypothetical protein [Microvirga splendida]|uniref:Uncharacterized protein n=1 Tax=Microvirga splendida TaxID=2795727 RepID=A0ABS0XZR0_9HYPH|nr:hypothetical protein [Microvirga splendida]MBJ6125180.1 hypothetical protein [Microvirga splendida]
MIAYTSSGSRLFITALLTTTCLGLTLLGPAAAQDAPRIAPDVEALAAPKDLQTILPLLLTSSDRRQLAADLESAIRKGDLKAAETGLNRAIEVGTLAIVLSDYLSNPDLLKALQDLNVQASAEAPSPMPAPAAGLPDACTTAAEIGSANLAGLQEALEQERSYSGMVSQTMTALMQEHNALASRVESDTSSREVQTAEMQQALQREQERSTTLEQELQRLQEEYRILQAAQEQASAPADIAASEDRLRRERERADLTERQLAGTLKDLRELQGLKDEIVASSTSRMAELEKAMARAQMRGDLLTQELAAAAGELQALKEPRQPGPAPVMFRLASTGAEPPLAPPQPETAPAQDATSALPVRTPGAVVVAALPQGIQPLPTTPLSITPLSITPLPMTSAPPLSNEAPAATDSAKADDRLVSRAEELLRQGDVSGARLVLEHALAGGHARAAFLLAETFDPNTLAKLGALGLKGDAAKAREFYARAQSLGMAQARERLEALR